MKVFIASRFKRNPTFPSPTGDGTAPVYVEKYSSAGVLTLEKVGVKDLHAEIQVSKDVVDVYNILDRFNAGDFTALSRAKGFFADVSAMPRSLIEVHNFMKQIDSNFDLLPAELKSKFGNSPKVFMKSVENGDFLKIFKEFEDLKSGAGKNDSAGKNETPGKNDSPGKNA